MVLTFSTAASAAARKYTSAWYSSLNLVSSKWRTSVLCRYEPRMQKCRSAPANSLAIAKPCRAALRTPLPRETDDFRRRKTYHLVKFSLALICRLRTNNGSYRAKQLLKVVRGARCPLWVKIGHCVDHSITYDKSDRAQRHRQRGGGNTGRRSGGNTGGNGGQMRQASF